MIDRTKVIKGLERCKLYNKVNCDKCPYDYNGRGNGRSECTAELATDALELLMKDQEVVVPLTIDDAVSELMDKHYKWLKKQEAVEPKQIIRKQCKKEHEDGSIDYFAEWYCPHCNMLILRGFDNPSIKFCYKCGKPILWEGR